MANVSFYLSIINWIYALSSALMILGIVMNRFLCSFDVFGRLNINETQTLVEYIHCA